jgi:GAF domain-containing protein
MARSSAAQRHISELTTLNAPAQTLNQALDLRGALDKAVNMVRCSRLRHAVGDKWGLAQHASVPLRSGDEMLGILNVATKEWSHFSQADLQLLWAVGSMLGTAIARAQLYEQVKVRRVQEQGMLLRLSQELLGAEELEPALQRLVRVGSRLLEADACAFVEADEVDMRAVLRAVPGRQLPEACAWPVTLDQQTPHLWYLPEHQPARRGAVRSAGPAAPAAFSGAPGYFCRTQRCWCSRRNPDGEYSSPPTVSRRRSTTAGIISEPIGPNTGA